MLTLLATLMLLVTTSSSFPSLPSCYPNPCAQGADCSYNGYGPAVACTCKWATSYSKSLHRLVTRVNIIEDASMPRQLRPVA